ncbi:hypothetical protein MJO28_010024 [Puccinia striiformis f. sp. tritici]|uniref:Uncharacterized protein n=1 Tax=Puccinia striiformis f. sp. tritici TaxID=168172 RepID=A0ACC0EAY8_9BASI|nr:hypothetical protein MJO28_010024 [Puccinia striiformis f. sp. tritici]
MTNSSLSTGSEPESELTEIDRRLIRTIQEQYQRRTKRLNYFHQISQASMETRPPPTTKDNSPAQATPSSSQELPSLSNLFRPATTPQHQQSLSSPIGSDLPSLQSILNFQPTEQIHHPSSPLDSSTRPESLTPIQPCQSTSTIAFEGSPLPPGRKLRNRKANQLKPYTIETKSYLNKLHHNGWEDAVVKVSRKKSERSAPSSSPLSIDGLGQDEEDESYFSEIERRRRTNPSDDQLSALDDSQIGQFCTRKFHTKQNSTSRHNQPHRRPSQPESANQGPPGNLHPSKIRQSSHSKQPKNNNQVASTQRPTSHYGPTNHVSKDPQGPSTSKSPVRQSPDPALLPQTWPSQLSSSPSIVFQSPRPSTSRKRTASPQNHVALPNPKRHSRLHPPHPKDHSSTNSTNQPPRRVNHVSDQLGKNPQVTKSSGKISSVNRTVHPPTSKPRNPGKSKASVLDSANTSRNMTHSSIFGGSVEGSKDLDSQDDEEEEEEEEEPNELPEVLHPKKVKMNILSRMMPRCYVTKAEKDLRLMEEEKKAGKMRLTLDTDSDDDDIDLPHPQPRSTKRPPRCRSNSIENSTLRVASSHRGTSDTSNQQRRQKEPAGLTWGERMGMRTNMRSSSTPQLLNSPRNLERSTSHASSVSSRISQSTSSRTAQVPPQARNKPDQAISLKDDHALWKTYESSDSRPVANHTTPAWRRQGIDCNEKPDFELAHIPIWDFKDFTPDFGITRLPANLTITSQVGYLSDGHITELVSVLNGTRQETVIEPIEIYGRSLSGFITLEEWQDHLSSLADQIHDEIFGWMAEDSERSKDALTEMGRWFKFMGRSISSIGFNDQLLDPMVSWNADLLAWLDDLAADAVNRSEFSNLVLVCSWGIFELVCRLDLRCRRRDLDCSTRSLECIVDLGHRSLGSLLIHLLEYGPPVTMGKLKAYVSNDDQDGPLFDVSVEVWASLLNVILAPIEEGSRPGYLSIDRFWTKIIDTNRFHARRVELSQIACGEAISYLSMMICAISQILPSGKTTEESRMGSSNWSILVDSLGKIPEMILSETLEVRMRERRDRYIRTLFTRILIFHERWNWQLCFDDGMVERLYKILNGGRLERLSIEVPEMNHRFGPVDRFPHILDIDESELKHTSSSEELVYLLETNLRTDDSCFGMFLKILVIGFKALQRPIDPSKQKEIEKIISRCNPLRQLAFKPSRELGPIDSKITEQSRSSLVNHSSLFLVYSILFPNTLKRQWSFLCNLYSFSSIDIPARSTHLKILCQFAKFLKPPSPSPSSSPGFGPFEYLKIIIKKISENLNLLKVEYSRLKDRESAIEAHLFGSSTTTPAANNAVSASSSSRDIFKKSSVENSTLRSELKEVTESINSRILLIVQILDSLYDLFCFFDVDLTRINRLGNHSLIYPPLFWLDSSWTAGLEESSLVKEKRVMNGLNKLICGLMERRREKLGQVLEDERWVKEVEEKLKEESRLGTEYRPDRPVEDDLMDHELVIQKNELKEDIEAVYSLDWEWVQRAVTVLPTLLMKSIQSFILDHQEHSQKGKDDDGQDELGIRLIVSLGAIDQLKAIVDPDFNWLQNFKLVEHQLGLSGLTPRPLNPLPNNSNINISKNKIGLSLMTMTMTSLMSYLIGNLGSYYQDINHQHTSSTTSSLTKLYRGQVRLEILRIWMDSLAFIEYTIQLQFSSLIILLESFSSKLGGDPLDHPHHELFCSFLPQLDTWNTWVIDNHLIRTSDVSLHTPCSWILSSDFLAKIYIHHHSHIFSSSKEFESKRIEFFDLVFGEMKKNLTDSLNPQTSGRRANIARSGEEERESDGEDFPVRIPTSSYVRLYKEIIGRLAESISTMNRGLAVLLSVEPSSSSSSSSSRDNPRITQQQRTLLEKKVNKWKGIVKQIILDHLSLHNHTNNNSGNLNQPGHTTTTDHLGLVKLDQFFNFISLPKLRILKSILGIT